MEISVSDTLSLSFRREKKNKIEPSLFTEESSGVLQGGTRVTTKLNRALIKAKTGFRTMFVGVGGLEGCRQCVVLLGCLCCAPQDPAELPAWGWAPAPAGQEDL